MAEVPGSIPNLGNIIDDFFCFPLQTFNPSIANFV